MKDDIIKVSFENGKTIIDGIPTMLYINNQGHGAGELYLKGIREKGIQTLKIEAQTDDFLTHTIKFATGFRARTLRGEE